MVGRSQQHSGGAGWWTGRALVLFRALLVAAVVSSTLTALEPEPARAAGTDLLMVTGDGTLGLARDADRAALFTSFGYTVTVADDDATQPTLDALAATNDVIFLANSVSSFSLVQERVRNLDIGIVSEDTGTWGGLMFSASSPSGITTNTDLNFVGAVPGVGPSPVGLAAVYSPSSGLSYWSSGTTALPAGADVLAETPGAPNNDALFIVEAGGALYSANTAANRRVFSPFGNSEVSQWTATTTSLMQDLLLWTAEGSTCVDSDADGLCDDQEDANTDLDNDPATNPGPDTDGDTVPNHLDADDDGDGTPTASENADPNADGDPRDALDSDRDGQPDYLDVEAGPSTTPIAAEQKISDIVGGFGATLDDEDGFGMSVASVGDLDGDGVNDLAVGARFDDDGGLDRGAVYVLFLNANGTVRAEQKVSSTSGGFGAGIDDGDRLGGSVARLGDLDGDGINDIAVGADLDDDGGLDRGAAHILFLNPNGTVKAEQKISSTTGGLTGPLDNTDYFGTSVAGLGDLDGDGTPDLAVGAQLDDDGGLDRGAVYILNLSAATITVNSTGDASDNNPGDGFCATGGTNASGDPECSLRAAIEEANASAVVDAIHFDIPAADAGHTGGVWTISPNTALPSITDTVTLDATTQSGATANTAAFPANVNSSLAVRLSGSLLTGTDEDGLGIAGSGADGSVIRGFSITDFDDLQDEAILIWDSSNNVIAGNHIGVGPSGTTTGGNTGALYLGGAVAADNRIGGTSPADRNLVAGNLDYGIGLGASVADLLIQGNDIGLLANGTPAANGAYQVFAQDGATAVVGGTTAGSGNRIANGYAGVGPGIVGGATISILGNRIWGQWGPGIDIEDDGPTPNDAGDADAGANDLLNYPVITSTIESGGTVSVDFELDVPAGTYRVELFTNPSGVGFSGYGPGEILATSTSISHTGSGLESFSTTYAGAVGDIVTATTTEDLGGGSWGPTSEFSAARAATCSIDSDGDGLLDCEEDANTDVDFDPGTSPGPDTDGDGFANYLDPDDDGDGSPTASENADPNGDGDPRDAQDTDHDGQPDYLDIEAGTSSTPVVDEQKISATQGGIVGPLDDVDEFGTSTAAIGDLDGDGVNDLVVGAASDDDGGNARGAVYVLFLNADGTVRAEQKISDTQGGFAGTLDVGDRLGTAITNIGDLDGDTIVDLAVGAVRDDDGGSVVNANRGAVYILFLDVDGTVKAEQKISDTSGGFTTTLDDGDLFGTSVAGVGDVDDNGAPDLIVGAMADDDGGPDRGAAYLLLLNSDGTVNAERKISSTPGGLTGPLDDSDSFARAVASLGDLDGDGALNLAVGSPADDDGGADRGAVYILDLTLVCGPGAPDSDGDGLLDCEEDANTDLDGDPTTNPGPVTDGDTLLNYLDADDDGDGTPTASENADPNADGDPRDAIDTDRDGQPDYLDIEAGPSTTPMTINGTTQAGFVPNTNPAPQAINWTQVIMIDGTSSTTGSKGLQILADDVSVSGLTIGNFRWGGGHGLEINGDRTTVTAMAIGADLNGSVVPNLSYGIWATGTDSVIGGSTVADRNLITGADNGQINFNPGVNTLIDGNLINTNVDATAIGVWNGYGIQLWSGNNVTIGTPAAGNVIGGDWGMELGASDLLIENNLIGTNDTFTADLGGWQGFHVYGPDARIVDNVIGNWDEGISVAGDNATLTGNWIGTDPSGTVDLGNLDFGIRVDGDGATIGGTLPGDTNVVTNNGGVGIESYAPVQPTILGNRISDNGNLGIDLLGDGVTANSAVDLVLDYPVMTSVVPSGGTVTIDFDLDVPAGSYRIEAFSNPSGADPSGFGEGEVLAGSTTVVSTGGGPQQFALTVPGDAGDLFSLTATEDLGAGIFGATSEFSASATAVEVSYQRDLSIRRTDLAQTGGLDLTSGDAGIAGNGFRLDGSGQRLVGPPTELTSGELTMSGWVRLDSAGSDPRLISKGIGAGAVYELLIDDGTGEAVARVTVGGSLVEVRGGSVPVGSWHQLAAVWDGSAITLYLDGVAVDGASATGSLAADLDEPLIVGNNRVGVAGLDGTIDQIELQHRALPVAEVQARFRNTADPSAFISMGAEQTAAPAPWTTSTLQSRTGGNALAAPITSPGADAWITAIGVDEPGVEFSAWWWVSDPAASEIAAGSRTGATATDQFDARASGTGLDLGVIDGATRVSSATDGTVLTAGVWQRIVLSTDELGLSWFRLDGADRLGPSPLVGATTGSVGFRAGGIVPGQQWYVDDVRVRRLVSDEPTTSLGAIERN